MAIVTNLNKLNKPTRRVDDIDAGETIAATLFQYLTTKTNGIGLAANQIGIDARVAVVNVIEPIYLINPEIIEVGKEINFKESCLSVKKKKGTHTKRYDRIVVKCDNYDDNMVFEADDEEDFDGLLECICVQHEIDHLDGKTILDRKYTPETLRVEKIGRNQKVILTNGSEEKTIKYKKAEPLFEQGWTLQEVL